MSSGVNREGGQGSGGGWSGVWGGGALIFLEIGRIGTGLWRDEGV